MGALEIIPFVLAGPPPPWEDPSLFSQQLISGIASGSLFALLALSIVMIYRSTAVLNFAQGEMAMFSTFLVWSFLTRMDFWPAFFLAMLCAAAMGAALERIVLRPVELGPPLNSLIVTLGLFTIFNGLALYIWGANPKGFGPFSAFKGAPYCTADVCIGRVSIGVLVMTVVIMVVLYLLFQHTKLGLALRATAQNRLASQLVGVPVNQMLTIGWALSAAIGAVAGVMVAQGISLTTSTMFSVLLYAFAGAVLGGLNSPVGAVLGGILVGVIKNMASTYVPPDVGSVDVTVAFAVIVIVLMLRPQGLLGQRVQRRV
jgi:branched-chain amino acid transport system permease protein